VTSVSRTKVRKKLRESDWRYDYKSTNGGQFLKQFHQFLTLLLTDIFDSKMSLFKV